jgi:hypothetical protein
MEDNKKVIYAPAKDFFGWWDKKLAEHASVIEIAKARGFSPYHSGGGCMHLAKGAGVNDGEGCEILVMVDDGNSSLPENADSKCAAGFYFYDENGIEFQEFKTCENLSEALDAADTFIGALRGAKPLNGG